MKRHFSQILIMLFMVVCSHISLCGQSITLTFTQIPRLNFDENELKHRIPPTPSTAIIDFDANTISLSPHIDNIESYEIRDEGQEVILYAADDEAEFVKALSVLSINRNPAILIKTATHTFISYVYPNVY